MTRTNNLEIVEWASLIYHLSNPWSWFTWKYIPDTLLTELFLWPFLIKLVFTRTPFLGRSSVFSQLNLWPVNLRDVKNICYIPEILTKKSMTIFFRIDWMIVFWKVELPKYLNNLGMFGQWLWHSWQRGCVWHRGPWFESSHRQLLMNNYLLTSLGYPALPGMIQMIF